MQKRFLYIVDPWFLFSLSIYIINKIYGRQLWNCTFCNFYLNDLLAMPILLPITLFFLKLADFRKHDLIPSFREFFFALLPLIIIFELIGPFFFEKGISDPLDILFYCIGCFISQMIWSLFYLDNKEITSRNE